MHQPRSGQEPSLRRKGSFAQAAGPRLGKNTNSEGCWNENSRWGEPLLAWARPPLAQRQSPSPGLKTAATSQSSHTFSLRLAPLAWARCLAQTRALRLSESSSMIWAVSTSLAWARQARLGEKTRLSPLFPYISHTHNSIQHTKTFYSLTITYQP